MELMSTRHQQILFLSGSGLPAWVWDEVDQHLPEHIQAFVAPRPSSPATLRDYATAAIATVAGGPFTIVAHSVGAVVGLAVQDRVPDRVRGLLAISGVVPGTGESFVSTMPFPRNVLLPMAIRLFGTRPPDKAIDRSMGKNIPGEVARRLVQDFDPDSRSLFLERLDYQTTARRRGYITTTADEEIAPQLQERFASTLGPDWSGEINSGHLPMVESPEELTTKIVEFIEHSAIGRSEASE